MIVLEDVFVGGWGDRRTGWKGGREGGFRVLGGCDT